MGETWVRRGAGSDTRASAGVDITCARAPMSARSLHTALPTASSPSMLVRLGALFAAVKTVQMALLALVPAQFDTSSALLLRAYASDKCALVLAVASAPLGQWLGPAADFFLSRVVDRLVVWDAVYFADLFAHGLSYEHQYVFCPVWWRVVRWVCGWGGITNFYARVLVATAGSNAAHFAAAVVLHHYTRAVFAGARLFSPARMAWAALVAFVLSPAGVFLTAPYAELAAALCSFGCLHLRERGAAQMSRALYVASGAAAAAAYGCRANCLLLGGVYLFDLAGGETWWAVPAPMAAARRTVPRWWAVAAGLVLAAALVVSNAVSYVAVCGAGDRGEWCDAAVPVLFAYAQAHYWNVGFLRYWSANNAPNFAFAAPVVFLLAVSVRYFSHVYPVLRVQAVLAVNGLFLVMALALWHVQIVTRIHTFLPSVYWLVAGLFAQNSASGRRWGRWCVAYFVCWTAVQTAMFGAFLPPA